MRLMPPPAPPTTAAARGRGPLPAPRAPRPPARRHAGRRRAPPGAAAGGRPRRFARPVPDRGVMTTTRSASATASATLCVTSTTVRGRSSQRRWSSASNVSRVRASSALNGSSSRSTGGSTTSARASPARWAIPPDSSRGFNPAAVSRPTCASTSVARARRSSAATPASSIGSATLSSTDRHGTRRGCWNARPTRPSPATGSARRPPSTLPASGAFSPATTRSSVLLPQPFGPITTVNEPAATSRSSPASASIGPAAVAKRASTPVSEMPSPVGFASSRLRGVVWPSRTGHRTATRATARVAATPALAERARLLPSGL